MQRYQQARLHLRQRLPQRHRSVTSLHTSYIATNYNVLFVAEPPTFIETPLDVLKVAEGQNATLGCGVFGAPRPTVSWTRDGATIEGTRYTVDETSKIVGNLEIRVQYFYFLLQHSIDAEFVSQTS